METKVKEPTDSRQPQVQSALLNRARGHRVSVLLTSGARVAGVLRAFDTFTLDVDGHLLYKHAVAAIMLNGGGPGAREKLG